MVTEIVHIIPDILPRAYEFFLSGRIIRVHIRRDDFNGGVAILLDDEEQLKGPAPEPLAEEPQQVADGEAPLADGGIGAPGPLPDAPLDEGGVVEGVGGEPKPKRPLEIPGIGPESGVKILSAHTIVNLLMPGVTNSVSLELDLGGRTRISDRSGSSVPLSTPHYNFLTVLADTLRYFLRATLQSEDD